MSPAIVAGFIPTVIAAVSATHVFCFTITANSFSAKMTPVGIVVFPLAASEVKVPEPSTEYQSTIAPRNPETLTTSESPSQMEIGAPITPASEAGFTTIVNG